MKLPKWMSRELSPIPKEFQDRDDTPAPKKVYVHLDLHTKAFRLLGDQHIGATTTYSDEAEHTIEDLMATYEHFEKWFRSEEGLDDDVYEMQGNEFKFAVKRSDLVSYMVRITR